MRFIRITFRAVDDAAATEKGFLTISVTVTDVNEAPVFGQTSYTAHIANGSPAGLYLKIKLN